jgi:hypothetical protein
VTKRIRRHRGGTVTVELEAFEARILQSLVGELLELLDEGDAVPAAVSDDPLETLLDEGPSDPPVDPALARLLPDGYRDDPEAAAEFRRFTERDLRDGKKANARAMLATLEDAAEQGGPLVLDDPQAHAWLYALNDLRLTLGSRLDVDEDYHDQVDALDDEDPRRSVFAIYEWLTGVQDTLVRALR